MQEAVTVVSRKNDEDIAKLRQSAIQYHLTMSALGEISGELSDVTKVFTVKTQARILEREQINVLN